MLVRYFIFNQVNFNRILKGEVQCLTMTIKIILIDPALLWQGLGATNKRQSVLKIENLFKSTNISIEDQNDEEIYMV